MPRIQRIIAIAVPCAAAYMNEAHNSWVLLGRGHRASTRTAGARSTAAGQRRVTSSTTDASASQASPKRCFGDVFERLQELLGVEIAVGRILGHGVVEQPPGARVDRRRAKQHRQHAPTE